MKRSPIVDGWPLVKGKTPRTRIRESLALAATGCWEWQGDIGTNGYGKFYVGRVDDRSIFMNAHRMSYIIFVGAVPDDLVVDHLCHNRRCVNPQHLEPVTQRENRRRAMRPACKHGHAFDEANTYLRSDGARGCRTCLRDAQRRQVERRKAAE